LDDCDQCALAAATRLQQRWVVPTVTNTRDPQFDTPDARIPLTIAIPVAFAAPSSHALVLISAAVLGNLRFHKLLHHQADALT
jgi:hypothetical protein